MPKVVGNVTIANPWNLNLHPFILFIKEIQELQGNL